MNVEFYETGMEQEKQQELIKSNAPTEYATRIFKLGGKVDTFDQAKMIASIIAIEVHSSKFVTVSVQDSLNKEKWGDKHTCEGKSSKVPEEAKKASISPIEQKKAEAKVLKLTKGKVETGEPSGVKSN